MAGGSPWVCGQPDLHKLDPISKEKRNEKREGGKKEGMEESKKEWEKGT